MNKASKVGGGVYLPSYQATRLISTIKFVFTKNSEIAQHKKMISTLFSSTNPVQVVQRWIAKDIYPCFSKYYNKIQKSKTMNESQNIKLYTLCLEIVRATR